MIISRFGAGIKVEKLQNFFCLIVLDLLGLCTKLFKDDWTIYSLHIPDSKTLYQDMLTVAEMNIETPHGHLHLLSEAHLVLRTALHKLTWLQVNTFN